MFTSSDIIHIPYTPDLSEGGIAYACHSLACTYGLGDLPADRLRRTAGGVAVELAFRRYLSGQAVPFEVLDSTPFTHPDHYNVALGRHRCEIISYLITRQSQIAQLRRESGSLLKAPALIPVDQFAAEGHRPDDLYLFAFLMGMAAAAQADIKKTISEGQPVFLIHPLPEHWARPSAWVPLEKLALKSESDAPLTVEIGGQNAERTFVAVRLELPPRQRVLVDQTFHSLAYVHVTRLPEARLGLHSPVRGEAYIVPPYDWGNIWIQGEQILLAGWLTHEEYRRKAKVLNSGSPTFQFDHTRTKNLLVPMAELNPLGILLKRVCAWEAERRP